MSEVIDRALMAHAQIKKRLCEAIRSPGSIDLNEIRSDRTCAFGLWIYGRESIRQSGLPQFKALKELHAQFHETAYQAALAVEGGRAAEAERSIAAGDFEMASRAMTQALVEMKAARMAQREAEQSPSGA